MVAGGGRVSGDGESVRRATREIRARACAVAGSAEVLRWFVAAAAGARGVKAAGRA